MAVLSALRNAVRASMDVVKNIGNKIPGAGRLPSFSVPGAVPLIGGYTVTGGFLIGVAAVGLVTGWVPFVPHYSRVM